MDSLAIIAIFLLVPNAEGAPKWKFNDANYESDLSDAVYNSMLDFHGDTLADPNKAELFNRLNKGSCEWDATEDGVKMRNSKHLADLQQLVKWIMEWKTGVMSRHNKDETLADYEVGWVRDRVAFWTIIEFCKYRWANSQQQPIGPENKKMLAWKMFDEETMKNLLELIKKSNRGEPGLATTKTGTASTPSAKATKKTTP